MNAIRHLFFILLLTKSLWVFSQTFSKPEQRSGVDFSAFSGLYTREKSLQDTLLRLQKMEELRGSAQSSLERLLLQKKTIDLELRYGELIVQRGRDLDQFGLEVLVAGDSKHAAELKAQSRKLLNQGLALHRSLLNKMKNHPMTAKVYLGIARTEYGLGRKTASLDAASSGLQWMKNPNAQQSTEVELHLHMVRGDSSFDLARASIAFDSYQSALKLVQKSTIEEAYLRYKLAWVYYNQKDPDSAIAQLDELFKSTRDRYALRNEAVQDYALFVADLSQDLYKKMGSEKGVYEYLSRRSDESMANQALERLAMTFAHHGRRHEAIAAHEFLIKELGFHENNYKRALAVVEWTESLADKNSLTQRYYWLIENFGPRSTWFASQASRSQVQRLSVHEIENTVRKYAVKLHQEASKESSADFRDKREAVVARLYDTHIENFNGPNDTPRSESGRVHFYRAEIHRHKKEWALAGERYDSYLRILDVVPKEQYEKIDFKLLDEALWGSVAVWSLAIEKDKKFVNQMIAAADRFLAQLSTDMRAPQVLLDAALVEQKSGQAAVALNRLTRLARDYPKTPQSNSAVETILDILNKEGDWINLAQNARSYIDSIDVWVVPGEKQKLHNRLNIILSQTEAKSCDALKQEKGRQLEAALCFERFARGFSTDEQAPKALLIASDIYDALKDPVSAVGALERLVKNYPKSEHAAGGFTRLATVYEKAFEFEKAASIYETLLTSNQELNERQKLLSRMLELFYSTNERQKLDLWLAKKDTPLELRREFQSRDRVQALLTLRLEELALGYSKSGLVSQKAQKIFEDFKNRNQVLSAEELLEMHRIQGNIFRAQGKLDVADKEWMQGLKAFWRISSKTPQIWELGARLRLEQASYWEHQFNRVDVMVSPTRKAELFQKLETWYAEIVEMRAPSAALSALWKAAELNHRFAEEIRKAPIPNELMGEENESQRKTYKKLIVERTEPLRKKSLAMVKIIARRAKEWKLVTPDVLQALKIVSQESQLESNSAQIASISDSSPLRFPWSDIPRWAALTHEQLLWDEWKLSDAVLKKNLSNQKLRRSQVLRSAFVMLMREGSFKDAEVKKWAKSFQDKAGIQLRIQAYLNDRDEQRAQVFLSQYESFFGEDTFSEFSWGELEWQRGNYSLAYLKWVRPQHIDAEKDFRIVYWTEGWDYMFDELIDGVASESRKKKVFSRLSKLASESWHKVYLSKLCIDQTAICSKEYSLLSSAENLNLSVEQPLEWKFDDEKSVWPVRKNAAIALMDKHLEAVDSVEGLEPMRKALTAVFDLQYKSKNRSEVLSQYNLLKSKIDKKQDELDQKNKARVLVDGSQR